MIRRLKYVLMMLMVTAATAGSLSAANFVDWKGGFWFTVPEGWDKVDYRLVDRYLSMADTSRDVFDYEAVFAPASSIFFSEDAYMVVTFDSTGPLTQQGVDSVLNQISESYAEVVDDAPIVQLMSDLVPGKPVISRAEKAISVLSRMAYRPDAMKTLWLYMRLNDRGLISLYFYSPDSTYQRNKPAFDGVVSTLSFANLKEAAGQEALTFTDIGGDQVASPEASSDIGETGSSSARGIAGIRNVILIVVIVVVVIGLIWVFVIMPRMKKKYPPSDGMAG